MRNSCSVAIIGAGVAGLSTAWELSKAGVEDIVVVDTGRAGGGTSLLGIGGVRTQFSHPTNVELSLRMLEILDEWECGFGTNLDFQSSGYLYLATTEEHDELRSATAKTVLATGGRVERLSPAEVATRVPALSTDGILSGWWSPDDGSIPPANLLSELLQRVRGAGVALIEDRPVELLGEAPRVRGLRAGGEEIVAETVVLAAGTGVPRLASGLGVELPIAPQRGQVFLLTHAPGRPQSGPLVLDMGSKGYFAPTRSGLVVGGGDSGDHGHVDVSELDRVLDSLRHRLGDLRAEEVRTVVAGVRAASPDDLGVLGLLPGMENVFVFGGYGHHGFMHALPSAEILAQMIVGDTDYRIDPAPMDPARLVGGGD